MSVFLEKPGFLLARIDQICTAIFSGLSETVTLNQAEFLLLLDRLGSMIQINLARAAGVDKSTTAFILDNLQNRGWIERTVNQDDRRSSFVSLTASGAALVPEVRRDFEQLQHVLQSPVEPARLLHLIPMLHRLGSNPEGLAPRWQTACDPASGVLDRSLSFLTRRTLQLLNAQFLAVMGDTKLTLRQFSLLFILSRRQRITQIEFARIFGVDPATCAVIMRGPLRRGLIASAPSPQDGRARVYRLTKTGRGYLEAVHPRVDRVEAAAFRHETAEDCRGMVNDLRAIVKAHSHSLRFPGAIDSR